MFGGSFGSRTTSAFGQSSTFGKPATSFSSGFGTSNTSLFGQQSQPATSLFGSTAPTFGQTTTTQSFGNFGSGSTSLFGTQQGQAGTTGGSLFGNQGTSNTTASAGLFGSPGSGAFGSNSSFGSFATTSNTGVGGLFGQNQPAVTQSNSLFGQTNSTGSTLFGSTSNAFSSTGNTNGTTIKFNPVTGTDTIMKNGIAQTISTKHYCITCMKEYESKSLEELRYEDYLANRKGPGQGTQSAPGGLFGGAAQAPLFGNNTNVASTSGGSLFGSSNGFGQTNVFGQSSLQNNSSLFGKPTSATPFGTTTTTQSTGFGSFGQGSSLFGSNSNQAKTGFGTAQTSASLFGSTAPTNTTFGSQNSSFGFGNQQQPQQQQQQQQPQPNQGIGLFGQQNKFVGFGAPATSNFSFGSNTGTGANTSLFSQKSTGTGFGIAAPTTSAGAFGSSPFGVSNVSTGIGSGSVSAGGLFSGNFNNKAPSSGGFSFGQNTSTVSPLGGANTGAVSLFGGGTIAGGGATKPTSLFGGTANSSTGLFSSGFGSSGGFGSGGAAVLNSSGFGGSNFGPNALGGSGIGNGVGNFLGTSTSNANSSSICDQIQVLSVIPYGNSPLYKYVRHVGGSKNDEQSKSAATVTLQKPNVDGSGFKISTQINNFILRKAHASLEPSKKSLFDKVDEEFDEKTLNQQKSSPRYLKLKPKSLLQKATTKTKANSSGDNANYSNIDDDVTFNDATGEQEPLSAYSRKSVGLQKSQECTLVCDSEIHTKQLSFEDDSLVKLRSVENEQNSRDKKATASDEANIENKSSFYDDSSSAAGDISSGSDNLAENSKDRDNPTASKSDHLCNIKSTRADYFTVPSLSDLDELVDDLGRCVVKNFTVGRHKYGNVTFYDAFDVAGLDLDSIVFFRHKEVEIYPNDDLKPAVGVGLNRRAQVTLDRVWPIDKSTREVINSPERLKQLNFVAKLKRSSAKMNAHFIEYRPLTGSWVFEVEHFSKYGLDESDEESAHHHVTDDKLKRMVIAKDTATAAAVIVCTTADDSSLDRLGTAMSWTKELTSNSNNNRKRGLDGDDLFDDVEADISPLQFSDHDQVMTMEDDDNRVSAPFHPTRGSELHADYQRQFRSPVEKLAQNLDTSLHKVQLMKASFYVDDDAEISLEKGIPDLDLFATGRIDAYRGSCVTPSEQNALPSIKLQFTSQFPPTVDIPVTSDFMEQEFRPSLSAAEKKPISIAAGATSTISSFSRVNVRPLKIQCEYKNSCFPLANSILKKGEKCKSSCDTALYFGNHFKVGWSNAFTFTCQSPSGADFETVFDLPKSDFQLTVFSGRKHNDFSSNKVHFLELKTSLAGMKLENIETHLQVCLEESCFGYEDGLPFASAKVGTEALHRHCAITQQTVRIDQDYDRQVWELMVALWGKCVDHVMGGFVNNHRNQLVRKACLSNWLKNIVSNTVEKENVRYSKVSTILSLLSCGKIYEACKEAIMNGDNNFALIISQIGGNELTRSLMEQQLKQWHESEADQLIDNERLKVMTLVAGHSLYVSSKNIVNTCENLDWKRAFALHLWYVTKPTDSLIEAVKRYDLAFQSEEKLAEAPKPRYMSSKKFEFETSDDRPIHDLCYHLLKLYSRRSYPLEVLLNPITHTANILNYRLSWLVMITLQSLGYHHLQEESEYNIHVSFAAQLEAYKLWHWAVFVLLHIKDVNCRARCVKIMIDKNAQLLPDNVIGLTDAETFICEKLQIPCEWIYHAKAVLAESLNRYREAAWYYIYAKRWNEAHEIITGPILTKAVMNEKYNILRELIEELVMSEHSISGWNYRGAIISDYLNVVTDVSSIVDRQQVDIVSFFDSIQSQLASVCTKIKYFPFSTSKERVCQAEISKRIIELIRAVLNIQYGKHGIPVRFIVTLIDQLPVPEDYKQQELQEIISWWINK